MVDNWTRRDGKAHEDMGRQWIGTTAFLKKIVDGGAKDACGNWNGQSSAYFRGYAPAVPHLNFLTSKFQTSPSGSAVPPLSIWPCCVRTNLDWRRREKCWAQGYMRLAFLG